jgi:DNA polymerase I
MEAWNPYKTWDRQHLTTIGDLKRMVNLFRSDAPIIGGGDTETTGLHITKDKPFLIIFGWNIPGKTMDESLLLNLRREVWMYSLNLQKS